MINYQSDIHLDVAKAMQEDIPSEDLTALLLEENMLIRAVIITREEMILCGQDWVNASFKYLDQDIKVSWAFGDGARVQNNQTLCTIEGNARAILSAERTALNFLQTLSATATLTRQYVDKIAHSTSQILDTRKTLPGLRMAQKYAVSCGGGVNHRLGLSDAILIKENHIKACGSIEKAVGVARELNKGNFIEVEVETLEEFDEAVAAEPDRIMLDNFALEQIRQAIVKRGQNAIKLEASGNVNLDTIAELAETGVDYISIGAITKNIKAIDLSMQIESPQ